MNKDTKISTTKQFLHYEFSGRGPTVVLLPGMFGSTRYWKDTVKKLNDLGKSTLVIDLLGFGRSPKPRNSNYTPLDHTREILAVIDACELQKPTTVVGVSMGATLIVELIRQRPDLFSKAVYISPMIFSNKEIAREFSYRTGNIGPFLRTTPIAWLVCNTVCQIKPLARLTYRLVDTNNQPKDIVDDATLHNWQSYSRSFENVLVNQNVLSDFMQSAIKTIVIYGVNDKSMEQELFEKAANTNSNINLVKSHVGHHPVLDDFDKTIALIV